MNSFGLDSLCRPANRWAEGIRCAKPANPSSLRLKNMTNEANYLIARSENGRSFASDFDKTNPILCSDVQKGAESELALPGAHEFSAQSATSKKSWLMGPDR